MKRISLHFLILATVCWSGFPLTSTAQDQPEKVTLNDFGWIVGNWHGKAMGGTFEETWSMPSAGSIMGMFKFATSDGIGFYEFLTIVPTEDSFVLRLKHFDAQLVGWEEKADSVEFPFVSSSEDEIRFDGLVFQKQGPDSMLIQVTVDQGNGPQVIDFNCQRSTTESGKAAAAIERVIRMDALISHQRNEATRYVPIADAIRIYVDGLDAIDYEGCPENFAAAFKNHRESWQKSIPFFESHADLRGEMHDVFDKIRESGEDAAKQLESHFASIMATWGEVESAQSSEKSE